MANPNLAKVIGVKVSAANIGEYVIVRNLTKGGQLTGKLEKSDRGHVFHPTASLGWVDGDVIQGEIRGRIQGVKQETIQSGSAIIKITGTADTTTPGVNL